MLNFGGVVEKNLDKKSRCSSSPGTNFWAIFGRFSRWVPGGVGWNMLELLVEKSRKTPGWGNWDKDKKHKSVRSPIFNKHMCLGRGIFF